MLRRLFVAALFVAFLGTADRPIAAQAGAQMPEQFFGFRIGTDGELARYPRVVEYLQHLAKTTDRVRFEELGKTTMGNPYVLATISAPANLAKLDRLVAINRRLADPRGLSEAEATKLAAEGRVFLLLYATIHSTEVGNGQAINEIAHRLATDASLKVREILDNVVVLLVPSQNPDGQVLVIDHWYKTKGTQYNRAYPDLYHKYVGHDNNRDWFMFTQKETRLSVEKVHNTYRPHITHDMHQTSSLGARIFVPPFADPYDPNIHPILDRGQAQIGMAMSAALIADGKTGIVSNERYDLWTPARQYMVYHGQPRILTEIASASLADPFVNPAGAAGEVKPLGPQERRWNYPVPYGESTWRLRQIVDYGITAVFGELSHLAKYRTTWLENFYRVHRDWVEWRGAPYAFVISAEQRDPFETHELLQTLDFGDVEIHQAQAAFTAAGRSYPAGSWVIKLAQPYGAFAKTMLEQQVYPDLRLFPGGPPIPPYDVTGHTLGFLMGVQIEQVDRPFDAQLELLRTIAPVKRGAPPAPKWAYAIGPESNAGFLALAKLQAAHVPVFRTAREFSSQGRRFAPGTWIVPPGEASGRILQDVSGSTGVEVVALEQPARVEGHAMRSPTRIGLWKGANVMPGGWLKWLFEQYGFNHAAISSQDFGGDLAAKYDTIVIPHSVSRETIVRGLDPKRNGPEWAWAYGVGEEGWKKLQAWVRNGGTLVAIGNATETARELLDLPIEKALPESRRQRRDEARTGGRGGADALTFAFQSPARLMTTLRDAVVDPESLFYCPGSLLVNEFNPAHPIGYGMPASWPVFFESDQAYRLRPGFDLPAEVVARYPAKGTILQSGWLLGEEYLRDLANVVSFRVGRGTAVILASQVDYRTQPRATFKLFFNAMFQGPAKSLTADELSRLPGRLTSDHERLRLAWSAKARNAASGASREPTRRAGRREASAPGGGAPGALEEAAPRAIKGGGR